MRTFNRKQGDYLRRARDSARLNDMHHCRVWIKKAAKEAPISEHQWHNIRVVTSSSFVQKMKEELGIETAPMAEANYNFGFKYRPC